MKRVSKCISQYLFSQCIIYLALANIKPTNTGGESWQNVSLLLVSYTQNELETNTTIQHHELHTDDTIVNGKLSGRFNIVMTVLEQNLSK